MRLVPLLERTARFFRLPVVSYDPVAEVATEGPGAWPALCLATWLMMAASLVAAWRVSTQPWLIIEMAVALLSALPVAYRLHYRPVSRLLTNWLAFTAAFALGALQLRFVWPLYGGVVEADSFDSMALLVLCFMWITVFRAFALRTVSDLVQTILPCGSIILLVLLLRPEPLILGCAALIVLSTLALLAAEYRIRGAEAFHPLASVSRTRGHRRTGAFYSWPTLFAVVLLAATLVAWMAARAELSGGWGEVVRTALARQVYRFMQPREAAAMVDNTVVLPRLTSWPNRDLPVFTAYTTQPGNWRTTCYHYYDGVRWERGKVRSRRARAVGDRATVPLESSGATRQSATRVVQRVRGAKYLVANLPVLFCPAEITVRHRTVRYDRDRCIQISTWIRPGGTYEAVSYTPPVVPMKRRGVGVPTAELATDLQLPDALPQRVRDLAHQLTDGLPTPLQRARAIEQYLMWSFPYTLEVSSGWSDDFVDHFLFVSKKGFCHHFAGSMVILCRCVGLPARLVSGYLRGEEDPKNQDNYTIREKDAHVWPEVYFAGAGWVVFEPTPAAPEERHPLADAWAVIAQGMKTGVGGVWTYLQEAWPSAAAVAAAAAILAAAWHLRRAWRLPVGLGDRPELGRVVRAYLRLRQALAGHGVPDPHLGPREVLGALPEALAPVRLDAEALVERYLVARFSGQPVPANEAQTVEELLARVRRDLRQGTRRRPRLTNPGARGDPRETR